MPYFCQVEDYKCLNFSSMHHCKAHRKSPRWQCLLNWFDSPAACMSECAVVCVWMCEWSQPVSGRWHLVPVHACVFKWWLLAPLWTEVQTRSCFWAPLWHNTHKCGSILRALLYMRHWQKMSWQQLDSLNDGASGFKTPSFVRLKLISELQPFPAAQEPQWQKTMN